MRSSTVYTCSKCDAQSPKWTGQCLACGSWGTLTLVVARENGRDRGAAARPAAASVKLGDVAGTGEERLRSGIGEIDRVFGGGIVLGSVTLLGGEPGIGKSTLALELCAALAKRTGAKIAYVSGEESAAQVKMRADRLKLDQENIYFINETGVGAIAGALEKLHPAFAVIDSVQTIYDEDIPSEAGAVNQLRGAAATLTAFAKRADLPLLLIGHVTKDGQVAGPKTLEHVVDAVLTFEGERSHPLRVLRCLKNRFGSTDETGVFDMTEAGLKEIKNPSAYLLEERRPGMPGSAVCCVIEGTRPILVEIQALVRRTAFGYPVRRATGFDQSRLEMLVAVLTKREGADLASSDVYVNVVGGLKVREPAADLAVAAAIISAYADAPLPADAAIWGEIGLGGEVRSVISSERRVAEAVSLGIRRIITSLPKTAKVKVPAGADITEIRTVHDLHSLLAGRKPR